MLTVSCQLHSLHSAVTPTWTSYLISSYDQDEKLLDLVKYLFIHSDARPGYTLKNGLLLYEGRMVVRTSTNLRS